MNAIVAEEFFAPTSADLVDALIAQYRQERERVEGIDAFFQSEGFYKAAGYYVAGNREELAGLRYATATEAMFKLEGALKALDASYWDRSLKMTDVLDFMPAKRREEWFKQIEKMDTPPFEEDTVRATLEDLMASRMQFLAERVDGIFQALSRTHVTNQPEGFGKRMILTGVTNDWGSYARSQTGHINDLRSVIAKFMGRDEPHWNATNRVVEIARRDHRGEWLEMDGGALRIRCYLNGNAHLEINPDMAYRLNEVLHYLHPMAIPTEFRRPPKRKTKEFKMMSRPLPFAVLDMLADAARPRQSADNAIFFGYGEHDKHVRAEAERVLEAIGGAKTMENGLAWFRFDYDPRPAINLITVSGCIPDQKSHQYYPTPRLIAEAAIEAADIGPDDECLEPSAGTGNLADLMRGLVTCIEISPLHCAVLEAKGYYVEQADFLEWAPRCRERFERIVMNPPFSQSRWQAHTEAAAGLVAPGGRLVAILPASAKGKFHLPGLACAYSHVYENQFAGASVDVVILVARRAA